MLVLDKPFKFDLRNRTSRGKRVAGCNHNVVKLTLYNQHKFRARQNTCQRSRALATVPELMLFTKGNGIHGVFSLVINFAITTFFY